MQTYCLIKFALQIMVVRGNGCSWWVQPFEGILFNKSPASRTVWRTTGTENTQAPMDKLKDMCWRVALIFRVQNSTHDGFFTQNFCSRLANVEYRTQQNYSKIFLPGFKFSRVIDPTPLEATTVTLRASPFYLHWQWTALAYEFICNTTFFTILCIVWV